MFNSMKSIRSLMQEHLKRNIMKKQPLGTAWVCRAVSFFKHLTEDNAHSIFAYIRIAVYPIRTRTASAANMSKANKV
jgi:hypothetical protein